MTPISVPPAHDARPTPGQLAMFRTQLQEQRQFRLEQLEQLRVIDPDRISEVTDALAAGARAALREVLAALRRMDDGSYGTCTDCGTILALEPLEVLPQVGQCLPCRRDAAVTAGR